MKHLNRHSPNDYAEGGKLEMVNLKPKEPLIAIILSFVFPGLGQVYANRVKRGIVLLLVQIFLTIINLLYIYNMSTRLDIFSWILSILFVGFSIFIIVDAYKSVKAYNLRHKLTYEPTIGRRTFYIAIILIIFLIFNPSKIVTAPVVLYIRANVVQAFKIPSETMKPTLRVGDRIFVDKMIYKKADPRRGDIIVFKYPEDTKKYFVKRLIGLPGETLEIKGGNILINGNILKEPRVITKNYYFDRGHYGIAGETVKIPPDSYYVLGDNSDSSRDSRYWGFVPKEYLIGRAYKIYFPLDRFGPIE